ncbi:hypothetical protein CLOM_g11460, partial [Closterium sp. NIES-68]
LKYLMLKKLDRVRIRGTPGGSELPCRFPRSKASKAREGLSIFTSSPAYFRKGYLRIRKSPVFFSGIL